MVWYEIVFRLFLSVLVGGIIGFQREHNGNPAGIKTNSMVCVGAAVISIINVQLSIDYPGTDVSRIIAQIVSGIGFIGAGCILHTGASESIIKGLTTASTLWVVACLGIAAGLGYYIVCLVALALVLAVLLIFGAIRNRHLKNISHDDDHIHISSDR